MNNVHYITEDSNAEEDRLQCACDWVAKIDRNLSAEEEQEFKLWIRSDTKNMSVMLETAKVYDKLDDLQRLADIFTDEVKDNKPKVSWKHSLAASILIALCISVFTFSDRPRLDDSSQNIFSIQTYQTIVGEKRSITLPDNSSLVLNTDTVVKVNFNDDDRLIELIKGELSVDVAHEPHRPLSVIVGGRIIQAIGTSFNVEYSENEIEVIVTDGKVLVEEFTSSITNKIPKLDAKSVPVSEGQSIGINSSGKPTIKAKKTVSQQDIDSELSWQNGFIVFRGDTLRVVIHEIERYTNVKFQLDDDERLDNIQIAGVFKTGDVDGLLSVLESSFKVQYTEVDATTFKLSYLQ